MQRSKSPFISALLGSILLGLFALAVSVVPSVAHADLPAGVTCSMIDGVYTCTQTGQGTVCSTDSSGSLNCSQVGGGGSTSGTSTSLGQGLGSTTQTNQDSPSTGWLSKLTHWIAYAIQTFFDAVVGLLKDLVTFVLAVILGLIAGAIESIGVPSWISQYSLGSLLGQTGEITLFFMGELQVPAGLGLLGLGYVFRLVRKFLTLFQW